MSHWQRIEKQEAQRLYDRAVKWMEENDPDNEELHRFRAEAEELMRINDGEEEQETDAPRINKR